MTISVYSDGEKKDKIAEFYDTYYPCSFLRGVLEETREEERDSQLTFTIRQDEDKAILRNMMMKRADV